MAASGWMQRVDLGDGRRLPISAAPHRQQAWEGSLEAAEHGEDLADGRPRAKASSFAVEAAPLAGPTGSTPRLIGDEGAVGDAQGPAGGVEDTAAPADLARAASRHIADQVAAGDGEGRGGRVEDAAAIPPAPPVGDRQADDDNVHPAGGDVEDPVGAMAADRQSIRPGPLDGQALVDHQLAMGQADGPGGSRLPPLTGLLHHHRKSMNIKELRIWTWVTASDCPARSYAQSVAPGAVSSLLQATYVDQENNVSHVPTRTCVCTVKVQSNGFASLENRPVAAPTGADY